ncbi:copper amine oxidase N-terminal domain-containing protein [Paenibacillus humicola]|uniref:copper amine oxidase N-terminal domain-containing protein n=1 Tax=Paenibacillus humicola TaxID=3110540 RepID=UPI00237B17ED|nr:copper amine oxidase N-terminal domain-containing protein [Paenibacillus humicola]
MRKKWMAVFGTAALALVIGSSVYAAGGIKLVVNGHSIVSGTAPRIIDGHTMVPIRTAAEALGANVNWDNGTKTVTIDTPAASGDTKQQIQLLQQALAPESADDAVKSWAEWVKNRNGAAQYALLSAALQTKLADTYKDMNWVTGLSSPWVDSYQVSARTAGAGGSMNYTVTFKLKDSTGDAGSGSVNVTVGSKDAGWLISGLQIASGADELGGIVIVPAK